MLGFPLRRLAEVFATLAPMSEADALRRAGTALETLRATRPRRDVSELGLALLALDLAPLNALGGAGFTTFGRGSQAQRERILLSWATSRIPQRRTAFQAMKRFGLFLAYADPGPDPSAPSNQTWERIGYRPPAPVVQAEPPPMTPMSVDREVESLLRLEADVVVVGSGAGGGVVAARLAAAGRSVLVLEAGAFHAEAALPRLEAEAWRDLYLDRGATTPHDLAVTILAGATVGGGTTINWTTSMAPPPPLRASWESEHGLEGMGGAETDAAIEALERELGVMEPSAIPPKDRLILDGAAALGWEAAVTRRNAGPCTDCGACGFGCPWGSKRSGPRTHLATAAAAGARILERAPVLRLLVDADRVSGVAARLEPGGRRLVVRAPQVVVAAGAMRTPLVLAASRIDHPEIGRHLRLHPTVAVVAQLAEPAEMWIGPMQAARSLEFAEPGPAARDGVGPAHGGFIIESAPAHPGLAAAALPWSGRDEGVELVGRLRHLAPLIALLRDRGEGRVRPAGRGMARIDYALAPEDGDTARRAMVEMARMAHAGGAVELLGLGTPARRWRRGDDIGVYLASLARLDTSANRIGLFSAHQMGTVRAGGDPRTAPCDPWGRVRRDRRGAVLRGGYVADASLFPTASGVNPMLTVMTLADRVARAVIDDGARLPGA